MLIRAIRIYASLVLVFGACGVAAGTAHATNPVVIYVHDVGQSAACGATLAPVLIAIEKAMPAQLAGMVPGATTCPYGDSNVPGTGGSVVQLRYVSDKADGSDRDVESGGLSGSGAGANADALRRVVDQVSAETRSHVMLVGLGFGGIIIRDYLDRNHAAAGAKVAGVAFLETPHQGSLGYSQPRSTEAAGGCAGQGASHVIRLFTCSVELAASWDRPAGGGGDSIASRDVLPRNDVVRLPPSIRYLNAYGQIDAALTMSLGLWKTGIKDLQLGDGRIPLGVTDLHDATPFGGAQLGATHSEAAIKDVAMRTSCPADADTSQAALGIALAAALHLTGEGEIIDIAGVAVSVKDAYDIGQAVGELQHVLAGAAWFGCVLKAPMAHWNLPDRSGDVQTDDGPLPDVVAKFLVDTCRLGHLGSCGARSDLVPFVFSAAAQAKLQSYGGPLLVPTLVPRAWGASTADLSSTFARGGSYNLSIAPPLPAGTPASDQAYAVGGFVTANQDNGTPCQPSPYVNGACDVFEARGHSVSVLRTGTSAGWAYGWSECGYSFGIGDTAHVSTNIIRATINSMHVVRGSCATASSPSGQSAPASCQNVRGYNGVTVTGVSCAEAASVLWNARQGSSTPGWDCHGAGTGPGGGFPVIETCTRGAQVATGSIIDGHA